MGMHDPTWMREKGISLTMVALPKPIRGGRKAREAKREAKIHMRQKIETERWRIKEGTESIQRRARRLFSQQFLVAMPVY